MEYSFKTITPESLGSAEFCSDYGAKYAYLAGAMYKAIASKEMIVAMARSGYMSFFGAGGMPIEKIASALEYIQNSLPSGAPYGVNLLCNMLQPEIEEQTIDLFLERGVKHIEAAAFMEVTPSLVRYRLSGLHRTEKGVESSHFIFAKISRPEVAAAFMSPAPESIISTLLKSGAISTEQAELSRHIPMADDICVESDSGGHTDQGVAYSLLPAIQSLRDEIMQQRQYSKHIRVGGAGGIGTPDAAAAAFVMGADFVMTGSINQCTVEAGTSDQVKQLLQKIEVQDTTYAPAGDMFEVGAKVQVIKKGVFFPARANKLYELYLRHESIDHIDEKTKKQIQERYFKRSFDEVWSETKSYYLKNGRKSLEELESNPKQKMALIFRWYFIHASRLAMAGSSMQKVDYQVHCGPAMGSFNTWVKGSDLEHWENRYVARIAGKIMQETALLLNKRFQEFTSRVKHSATSES